jgi:hypothetical protein
MLRSLIRRLPLPDYWKTVLWSRGIRPPKGRTMDWPYYRGIELVMQGLVRGYMVDFPKSAGYSMLEFGVANGQSFQYMLHCRDVQKRKLRTNIPIIAVGFDTFEGIPAARTGDGALPYRGGDFSRVNMQDLDDFLKPRFQDYKLVRGRFDETLPPLHGLLKDHPPLFISVDCDYYSSTMDVFQHVLPYAPNGSFWYFDDISVNFYSPKTGEMRAVQELNAGAFGDHLQLLEYPLWIETGEMRHFKQVYRLFNMEDAERATEARPKGDKKHVPRRKQLSPL